MSNFDDKPCENDNTEDSNSINNHHFMDIQEDKIFSTLGATLNKLQENMDKMTQSIMSKLDVMSNRIEQLESCVDELVEKAQQVEKQSNLRLKNQISSLDDE